MLQSPVAAVQVLPHLCPFRTPALTHQANDHPRAGKRWQLAAFLLLGRCHSKRTGVANVVPGGRDPAVEARDMRGAGLVDVAVEAIGHAGHMPSDAKGPLSYQVLSHWLRCLRRRSQRHRLTWRKMMRIAERWLPGPRMRHPWRFDIMTPAWEPRASVSFALQVEAGGNPVPSATRF
jgi:hypothetical protein